MPGHILVHALGKKSILVPLRPPGIQKSLREEFACLAVAVEIVESIFVNG